MMPTQPCAKEPRTIVEILPHVTKFLATEGDAERPVEPAKTQDNEKGKKDGEACKAGSKKSKMVRADKIPKEGATTLMIRGIPCGLSREDVMSSIDSGGFKGKYNFFYLPHDVDKKSANLGYAFINFVDVQSAGLATEAFTGVRLAKERSAKKLAISPASIQGLPNLRRHFANTVVSKGSNGPLFLAVTSDSTAEREAMPQVCNAA